MKHKLTYIEKIRLALFFDLGQMLTLLIVGGGVMAVVSPIFFTETSLRAASAFAGGAFAILVGLPIACMRRLQSFDDEFGVGVADAVVEWFRASSKGDVLDLNKILEKIQAEKKQSAA